MYVEHFHTAIVSLSRQDTSMSKHLMLWLILDISFVHCVRSCQAVILLPYADSQIVWSNRPLIIPLPHISMDPAAHVHGCSACCHSFCTPGAYQNHLWSCQPTKKCCLRALEVVKDAVLRKWQCKNEELASNVSALGSEIVGDSPLTSGLSHQQCWLQPHQTWRLQSLLPWRSGLHKHSEMSCLPHCQVPMYLISC